MKVSATVCFLAAASLQASPPVVIYQPARSATVVSPLTTATAANNQALLSQINATMQQRAFQHQVLTLTKPETRAMVFTTPVIRAK